jgi:hypothetical protein
MYYSFGHNFASDVSFHEIFLNENIVYIVFSSKSSREGEGFTPMQREKYCEKGTDNLAEKCRIALEKSYGSKIPLPQSLGKHERISWFKSGIESLKRPKESEKSNS